MIDQTLKSSAENKEITVEIVIFIFLTVVAYYNYYYY